MKVGKSDALFGKGVNMGRVDDGITGPAQVAVALIVGHDEDNVRASREKVLSRQAGSRKTYQQE